MIYIEVDIEKELPPNTNEYFIVKYNGNGSWYDGEVSSHTGKELNGDWGGMVKSWLKPIEAPGSKILSPEEFYDKHYQYLGSGIEQVTRESAIHFAEEYRNHIISNLKK